ncbi:YagK/YfjJ domain-containing protein [Kushneria indalinina]|uniref:Uncharacterized protein DUF3296 n=1 Tax=Kushneria indalinina DSM 14324 TaxID=1122140 RepID=A0A3D9DW19_9GAMM|nr:inovirus-type Gp2 protein [Kushneria indalinina]REC94970.1 uncharacterized protein DUF3296 [Kushneria indalinina DSM 14324]
MFPSFPLRHPDNDKLRLFYEETYCGYAVMQHEKGPLIENFLERSLFTLNLARETNRTTFAFRVDLHFPDAMPRSRMHDDNVVLARFFRFFFYELRKANTKYPPTPRYLWAREQASSNKPHYHLMLLFNKDAFDSIGKFAPDYDGIYSRQNIYHRIMRSWLKAMGFDADDPRFGQLVNVSKDPVTKVPWSNILHLDDWYAMDEAMFMASYLCKAYSKPFNQGIHVFDSSRR